MAIKFDDYLAKLLQKEQRAIKRRSAESIAGEVALRRLREARERSQEEIGRKLGINQAEITKLERRTDMYLSTLRSYIEAMGGELEITARFPDTSVRISRFESLDEAPA